MFAALIVALPTQPNAVRLRVWRGLKAMGCAALRDGAYLLPLEQAERFEPIAAEVRAHGGTASVWQLTPRDDAQRAEVLTGFDRGPAYAEWHEGVRTLHAELPQLAETDAKRRWRSVAEALQALREIDYFPGPAAAQAQGQLDTLRQAIDARFSKGEPSAASARSSQPLPRLDARRFRGKRWATRQRPWVDRLACAWLIRRFIDPQARFVWLADPAKAPRGVLGFDYDGARFTHVGSRVSFEVIAASFGLDADSRVQRIAQAVHFLDVGGIPAAEAAGLEAVLGGLREVHADDDTLTNAAAAVFDALYAAPGAAS
jgi:hypothetical protein